MHRSRRHALLAVVGAGLLTWLAAAPVHAQRWSDFIPVGERIRVRTRKEKETFVGTFRPSLTDSLTIVLTPGDRDNEPVAIPLASSYVRTVEVSNGYARATRGIEGFVIGAVAGGLLGHIVGGWTACSPPNASTPQRCYAAASDTQFHVALFTIGGAGAGAAVGVLVGETKAPEKWRNVFTNEGAAAAP